MGTVIGAESLGLSAVANLVNNSLIQTLSNLTIAAGTTITQSAGGIIECENISTVEMSGATINGGAVESTAKAEFTLESGFNILDGVSLTGPILVDSGATLQIEGAFANNGTITVGNSPSSAATLDFNGATLSGTGVIALAEPGANALLTGGPLTLPSTQTINGEGTISCSLTNNGTIDANTAGEKLVLDDAVTGTGKLEVGAGATLQLGAGSGSSTVGSLSIAGNGVFDLTNNHLFIQYGSASDPISTLYAYLKSGFNNGSWNGPDIISSTAQSPVNGLRYGVGWADGNDGTHNVTGLSSGTIELKYTLLGDANLDGTVNGSDFSILAANFGDGVTNWDQGNFLFTSAVNGSDFSALAANFGQGDSGADVPVSQADIAALNAFAVANDLSAPPIDSVPEPAGCVLSISACVATLLSRRPK